MLELFQNPQTTLFAIAAVVVVVFLIGAMVGLAISKKSGFSAASPSVTDFYGYSTNLTNIVMNIDDWNALPKQTLDLVSQTNNIGLEVFKQQQLIPSIFAVQVLPDPNQPKGTIKTTVWSQDPRNRKIAPKAVPGIVPVRPYNPAELNNVIRELYSANTINAQTMTKLIRQ
jgi:hypothetical protein